MLGIEKERMEFQKNEQIEGLKKAMMDREAEYQKEKEALLHELVQLRAQVAQLTGAYNAARAELGK
eukprot:3076014-Lingulodinium_polyedra.AAC.1